MRDYGKVHTSFWSSNTIRALSEDGRTLALYLMTSPHTTIAGVFRLPDGYACEDLVWTSERVAEGFAELFANGFANRCATTKWVWIVKHLDWNPPENPNQRKAAIKCALMVPTNCVWRNDFLRERGPFLGLEAPEGSNPSPTVAQPIPNQEQKQEQEQEQNKEPYGSVGRADPAAEPQSAVQPETTHAPALAVDALDRCPHDSIVRLYHDVLPELPRCRLMSDKRRRAITNFWRWVLTSKKSDGSRRAHDADQALTWVQAYFERARGNDFVMGRSGRSPGHENWTCDLEYLLSEKGRVQVIEKTKEAA